MVCMKRFLLLGLALFFSLTAIQAADFVVKIPGQFSKIVSTNSELKKLAGGMKFVEGPVWVPRDGGYLIFSDIPAEELKQWSEKSGLVTYRTNDHGINGNTVDKRGRLVSCEHLGRRVSVTEKDGAVKTLVDNFEGKRFNSPNDVVVKSDGTVWFTDPDYGLGNQPKEVAGMFVYRFDPKSKELKSVAKDLDHPNGLCFSPNEKLLYVADSGAPHHIKVYDVEKKGGLSNGRVFCVIDKGVPDGIRADKKGNIYSSAGDGVQIFNPEGKLIGKILIPESPANLCFGGKDSKTLFITARSSLYSIPVLIKGNN